MEEASALCVIPARGGSKRLPGKNIKPLAGTPLIGYSIEAALESGVFDDVIVSTEDDDIASVAQDHGAEVPFKRPERLSTDEAQVVDVCEHALDRLESDGRSYDILGVLLPTTPLRQGQDVRGAYEKFISEDSDFLICVTDYVYSPFEALSEQDGRLHRFWDTDSFYELRSQELPDLVVDNGAGYFMHVDAFRAERTFYGEDVTGYHMPLERSIDVDTPSDFKFVQALAEG